MAPLPSELGVAAAGLRNEREVLTRRLRWSGFIIFDHVAQFATASEHIQKWLKAGALRCDVDISEGIEHAPGAIAEIYAGTNRGKKLIRLC